jgi:predicted transcriptional regulator
LEGLKVVVPFNESACKDCVFRGRNGTCTLLGIKFTSGSGAFKCYTTHNYSPRSLVDDIISYVGKNGPVKVKDIGKHFGFSYQKAIRILEKLEKTGVIKRVKWGRAPLFTLGDVDEEKVEEAVQLVSSIYPFSSKGKFQRKNSKELMMALVSASKPAISKA